MKQALRDILKRVCRTEHTILPQLKGKHERELRELVWDAYDLLTRDRIAGARKPRQEKRSEENSS